MKGAVIMEIIEFLIYFAIASGIFVLVVLLSRKHRRKKCGVYDERQELIRGKGYALGFWVMLIYYMSYWFSLYNIDEDIGNKLIEYGYTLAFIGLFLGLTSTTVYSILNDAYFTAKQKPKSFLFVSLFMALTYSVPLVIEFCDGVTFDELLKSPKVMFLLVGCLFIVAAIATIIKMLRSRNEEADE